MAGYPRADTRMVLLEEREWVSRGNPPGPQSPAGFHQEQQELTPEFVTQWLKGFPIVFEETKGERGGAEAFAQFLVTLQRYLCFAMEQLL